MLNETKTAANAEKTVKSLGGVEPQRKYPQSNQRESTELLEKTLTGYPSIDRPWLKYYSKEAINAPLPEGSMYDFLWQCNKDYLEDNALEYFGRKITYKELFANIDTVAAALRANGIGKGDVVSICSLTIPETVYLVYAVNQIGAVSNMLAVTSTAEDLQKQINDTDSKLLFALDIVSEKLAKMQIKADVIIIPLANSMKFPYAALLTAKSRIGTKHRKGKQNLPDKTFSGWKDYIKESAGAYLKNAGEDHVKSPGKAEDLAVIEYTGGTTGEPKGVMIANVSANVYLAEFIESNWVLLGKRGMIFLDNLPMFLAYGLFGSLHVALGYGCMVVLSPDPNPKKFPALIKKYRPNHFCCGPLHLNEMMADKKINAMDLSFIHAAVYGGEKATPDWEDKVSDFLLKRGAAQGVINGYGMTELVSASCIKKADMQGLIPLAKNNMKILDTETGEELGYGKEGEICISSPQMMMGYYGKEKETKEVIFEADGQRWLKTGDLGTMTADGFLTVTGRIKRIYWCKDKDGIITRIYPMRIEEIICKLDPVEACTVIGRKNKDVGYESVAFVKLKADVDEAEMQSRIRQVCAQKLPDNYIPAEIIFVSEFPLTKSGKVDYRALEERGGQRT